MARSFNGSTDKIVADSSHTWTNLANYSLSLWFKTSATQSNKVIYAEEGSGGNDAALGISSTGNKLRWTVNGSDTSGYRVLSSGAVNDGNWHHACWTQNSSAAFALFLDGASVGSGSATPPNFTPANVTFGNGAAGTNAFTGTIADIAIFGAKLTAAQVASLANGLPASFLGPTHYWPLWGVDSPEPDIGTGTKVTATLTGSAFASGSRVNADLLTV